MIEKILIALVFALVGFWVGKRVSSSPVRARARLSRAKIAAYIDILDSFHAAERELSNASLESETDGQVSDDSKEKAWNALNLLNQAFYRHSFYLPAEVIDKFAELSFPLGSKWTERLDELRAVKIAIHALAAKDVGCP